MSDRRLRQQLVGRLIALGRTSVSGFRPLWPGDHHLAWTPPWSVPTTIRGGAGVSKPGINNSLLEGWKSSRYRQLVAPLVLILAVALVSLLFGENVRLQFRLALVITGIVISLHTFTGNSGVISFGHISFVAIGAFSAGLMSLGVQQKEAVFPELFGIIGHNQIGNLSSLLLAAVLGAIFAFVVGLPLMRLNGLSAGIATFAVLGITRNVLRNWTKIGPGAKTIPGVPETTGTVQAVVGLIVILLVAFAYQHSRFGRRLRASREDAAAARSIGVAIHRERLISFTLSGALGAFAGALYVHYLGSVTTEQVYLDLTFVTLSMLVVGGIGSLWGAVVGGLAVSGIDSFLAEAQNGISIGGSEISTPSGSRDIVLGLLMVLVLLRRPEGLSRGREMVLSVLGRHSRDIH